MRNGSYRRPRKPPPWPGISLTLASLMTSGSAANGGHGPSLRRRRVTSRGRCPSAENRSRPGRGPTLAALRLRMPAAGEHRVAGRRVHAVVVRHRADDVQAMRLLGQLGKQLAELHAGQARGDRRQFAANPRRGAAASDRTYRSAAARPSETAAGTASPGRTWDQPSIHRRPRILAGQPG